MLRTSVWMFGLVITSALIAPNVSAQPLPNPLNRLGAAAGAGQRPVRPTNIAVVPRALVSAIDDVAVPAQEAGAIFAINVQEGVEVAPDGILAVIDQRESLIKRTLSEIDAEIASLQAKSDVKIRMADKTAEVAKAEWEKSLDINKRSPGAVPETEVRRQKLTYERQLLESEFAKMELDVAKKTADAKAKAVEAADNDVQKRQVSSPVHGFVDKVFKRKGEWVTPGEQVFRIVRMDRLRVEGFLSFNEFHPSRVKGQPAVVEVRLTVASKTDPNKREELVKQVNGTIGFVSTAVESGDYRVWAEVENVEVPELGDKWLLYPGTVAAMVIKLKN